MFSLAAGRTQPKSHNGIVTQISSNTLKLNQIITQKIQDLLRNTNIYLSHYGTIIIRFSTMENIIQTKNKKSPHLTNFLIFINEKSYCTWHRLDYL